LKGIYITDGAFSRVLRHTIVDTGFSVDLARFAACAFLEPGTVMAVSENKSYVALRESDRADAAANYRFFLASFDKFNEVARSRLTTVRARMMYVMAAAFDPETQSVFTVTVPNARVKRLVVSRFDRRDMTLSEEFTPALSPASGLTFKAVNGSLDSMYVSGAAFASGKIYAISAAFGTLLVIDPQTRTVVTAHAIPGLERPVGIAVKGVEAFIIDAAGALTIVPLA
jgi:DNA-binding beta-propeller fold protein YncE